MIDIQCKDGKYIIDARIHSEVDTNDIAKVQERFTSDCAYEFAEAMRKAVNISHLVMKEKRGNKMSKTLIVVDMQNDFIDGSLGTKEAQAIVSNVAKKIKEYKDADKQVIFTRDTHPENYLETYEGKHLPVTHCVKNTVGWQISDKLDFDIENDILIDKPTFGWLNWKDFGFESVEICGLCTDICVVSNALIIRANYPEIDITVDASCCAGVTPDTHKAALATMKMCQIEVIGENNEV